jgi:hypothetical protein
MAKETVQQRDKRTLDLQLDSELGGTFPASDPLTITRFPHKRRRAVRPPRGSNADGGAFSGSDNAGYQGRALPGRLL